MVGLLEVMYCYSQENQKPCCQASRAFVTLQYANYILQVKNAAECEPMSRHLKRDCSYVRQHSDNTICELDLTLSCHTRVSRGGLSHGGARKTIELSKLSSLHSVCLIAVDFTLQMKNTADEAMGCVQTNVMEA